MTVGRSAGEIAFEIVGDTSKLGAQVTRDMSGIVKAANSLSAASSRSSIFGNTLRAQFAAATAEIHKTGSTLRSLDGHTKAALGSANGLGLAFGTLSGKIQRLPVAVVTSLAAGLAGAAAGTVALGVAISKIGLESASMLQNTQLAIASLGDQLGDIGIEQTISAMRELSVVSGVSLETITKQEQAFVSLGISGKGSLAIIKATMDGLAASGNLTEFALKGVGRALQQIGSKPFLQLEELNQIADQIPAASRVKIIKQIAKDTGDSITEVQERFRLGTQQSGDALSATIKVIQGLDTSGKALENRLNTLGGAFTSFQQRARLALGDVFAAEDGPAAELAKMFNEIDIESLATQVAEPLAAALTSIIPPIVEALPDIAAGLAVTFKVLAPVVGEVVGGIAKMAELFVENQDAIQGAMADVGNLMSGLKAVAVELAPVFEPVLLQLGLTLDLLGRVGQALEFVAPIFSFVGKVAGRSFTPFLQSIKLTLHALEQLLEGIGLIPESIPILGKISEEASQAAAALHAVRMQLSSLGSQAGAGSVSMTGGNKLPPGALLRPENGKIDLDNLALPKFANTAQSIDKQSGAVKGLASSLDTLFKSLNKYAKDTGGQSLTTLQNNAERIIENIRDAISKASDAGNRAMASALQGQLKVFREGNKRVIALAKQRDAVIEKLTTARGELEALKDESAQFIKSVTDGINALGNITQDTGGIRTTFLGMRRMLKHAIADTLQFKTAIDTLRGAGLNETSLRQIVEAGVSGGGLEAATALARRGQAGVAEINALQGYLSAAGQDLATGLNNEFYTAGIRVAEGLVAGLQSQEAKLVAAMDKIADKLVSSIKKKLKIASPSAVFEDDIMTDGVVGGLVRGASRGEKAVASAMGGMGQTIVNLGGVQVNGVEDPKAAMRSGLLAGDGIADILARRSTRAVLAGER